MMDVIDVRKEGNRVVVEAFVPTQTGVKRKKFERERVKVENLKAFARAWADRVGVEEWGEAVWNLFKEGVIEVRDLRDPSFRFKESWIRGGKVRELRWLDRNGKRKTKMLSVGEKRNRQQCLEQMSLIKAEVMAEFYGYELHPSALEFDFQTN